MLKTLGVIPSRYASERFPGKPLVKLGNKIILQWVWEAAKQCSDLDRLIVATDDERIRDAVATFGGEVVMTSENHNSGTERIAEVAKLYPEYDIMVNIQGDEPGIDPQLISKVAKLKQEHPEWELSTAACPLARNEGDPLIPERVKVVISKQGKALYFSRSLIPFPRNKNEQPIWIHLGIYAYQRDFLLRFHTLPPSYLEKSEALEQLRVLENDFNIGVCKVESSYPPVDTPEDLVRLKQIFKENNLIN